MRSTYPFQRISVEVQVLLQSDLVQPLCSISFLTALFVLLTCIICVWIHPAVEMSHSFDLEGLPYLNSHGPGQLILHGEELEIIMLLPV